MKCSKCGCKNILKANYCKNCGKKFTDKQKDESYQKTIYYKINKTKDVYDTFTLSKLTSHPIFRGTILFTIIVFGIFFLFKNGSVMKIEKSSNYNVYYNEMESIYYLITKNDVDKVFLNLYIPNSVKKIMISHFTGDGELLQKKEYKSGEDISLEANHDDYYVVTSKSSSKEKNSFKVYLYHKSDVIKVEK